MEYLIIQIIQGPTGIIRVERDERNFENYPSKFDEIMIQVGEKQVKTEIVHIENNTIFVEKITS
ncbi:hypothetical protein ACFO4P_17145 [Epilithonimonas pallida]|uniref:Uncharacterized protein n=1 Tax=Epilithonimonas pallida TaxID=373671 RepID=A0ABY1R654_9FLAO|nr:hypothetical protein [Epilithonimonas pallida]SMP94716.1 hypothetical protein SAMN05421679_106115 [Epilithonimonas pallida]